MRKPKKEDKIKREVYGNYRALSMGYQKNHFTPITRWEKSWLVREKGDKKGGIELEERSE